MKNSECNDHIPFYQPYEADTNVQESYFCDNCGVELPMPEPDWDAILKEDNL